MRFWKPLTEPLYERGVVTITTSLHPKVDMNIYYPLTSFSIAAAHADSIHIPPRRWFHSRDLSWWTHVGLVVCQHASCHSRDKTRISEMWLTQGTAPHAEENPVSTQWITLITFSKQQWQYWSWIRLLSSFITLHTVPAVIGTYIVSLYQSHHYFYASWKCFLYTVATEPDFWLQSSCRDFCDRYVQSPMHCPYTWSWV